jgi:hypothetical protein
MAEKTPKVLILGPITPTTDSIREDTLQYAKLQSAVDTHTPHEYQRIREFWDTEEDSLVERGAAQQLAAQYLLMGSLALNTAQQPESKELWSSRYTQATSELYGIPDVNLARHLHEARQHGEKEWPFEEVAKRVGEYLSNKYADVYAALDLENAPDEITPDDLATRFESGMKTLAESHDPAWNSWTVERSEEKDSLSVKGSDKHVLVGMKRANVRPEQLKALFTHEVLVHGLRAVNGEKYTSELKSGLPGYLDAEEGLGVFMEYAISGTVSEKNIDRYVDIAYALGQLDGVQHNRAELIELAMDRALQRNEQSTPKLPYAEVEKEAYAHVNRVYRGSLGNEHVGIFTKDIAYHTGFMEIGAYITEQLENDVSVGALIEFLVLGKFDPTNPAHVQFVQEHTSK